MYGYKISKIANEITKTPKTVKKQFLIYRKQVSLNFQKLQNFQMSASTKAKKYMCLGLHAQTGFTARNLMWEGLRQLKKMSPIMVGRRRKFFAQKRSETLKQPRFYFKMYFFYSIFTQENNNNIHVSDKNVFTSNGMKIKTK